MCLKFQVSSRTMPLEKREDVTRRLQELSDATWSLSILRVLVERGLIARLASSLAPADLEGPDALPAGLARPVLDLLVAQGLVERDGERFRAAPGLAPLLEGSGLVWLRADLRTSLLQSHLLVEAARRGALELGWSFTDPEVLQAQGDYSVGMFDILEKAVLPGLGDLHGRFRTGGAAMLDVGAGVAGISIALCRGYPSLRMVALEPAPAPLALARENVARAGLADRIELRAERVEAIDDESAFDLIWLPQMFLPDAVLGAALPRLRRALKPHGWLLTISLSPAAEGVSAAAARLRNVLYGGGTRTPERLLEVLGAAGFSGRAQPGPGSITLIVAPRPA